MVDVSGLKLSLDAGLETNGDRALAEIARQLGIDSKAIKGAQLLRRSVDARKRSNVHFSATYRLDLAPTEEVRLLERAVAKDRRLKGLQINPAKPYESLDIPHLVTPAISPVVVGFGPAGMFASWYLAKCGLDPIVVEQGAPVEERAADVARFFETGELKPWSNIQFGEGGAGAFSDGKLTTNLKNRYTPHVLHWFVEMGAPESILWQAHPHLGSDNLARIVANVRNEVIQLGGTVRFYTQLVDLAFAEGELDAITLKDTRTGAIEVLPCRALVMACGHSARGTFELVYEAGLSMDQKAFSMGVRIEHPQALINQAQWGSAAGHLALEAAEYKLVEHLSSGRSVYSFCMCPGGEVVAAASEEGGIVTNGMSNYARDGKNANAALLVNVEPSDFGSEGVLAGMELQRQIEQRAFQVSQQAGGAPYQAPSQRVGDFLAGPKNEKALKTDHATPAIASSEAPSLAADSTRDSSCEPTYERGVVEAPLDQVFPSFITNALREALPLMAKKIAGFDHPNAILTAPETRSSSPVRINRDPATLQAYFSGDKGIGSGIYPCGEGPGFAGGIMSAAVDGLKVGQAVAARYEAREENQPSEDFANVIEALQQGKAALFPTDTVYGLGVAVNAAESPNELYGLKQRSDQKPIAWLVGSLADLETYGKNIPVWAKDLAVKHWPGGLTLVVEASDAVPEAYRSSNNTIALRIPNNDATLQIIQAVGPLATTSANLSGDPAPTSLAEVPVALRNELSSFPGRANDGVASTIIDCTGPEPKVLRQGGIHI